MRYIRLLLPLLLLFSAVQASAQYDFLVGRSYADRAQLVDSILFSPTYWKQDSANYFDMMDDIAAAASTAEDDELYWQTEISRIEYYTYNWLYTYKESIEKLEALLPKLKNHPKLVLQISNIIGLHYFHNDEFVKAFEYLIKYKHILDQYSPERVS